MFQLTDITKSFGATVALSKISLEIKQGEHVAIIGPSGSGKTTFLKLLNGQVIQNSGSYSIAESHLNSLSNKNLRRLRSEIAYIPQDLGLIPQLKVFQNILLGRVGKHSALGMLSKFLIPPRKNLQHIFSLLQRVGIPEKMYHHTATLSGGQQQRVAVARALFQQAHSLLADEPISAVDPARARSLITLLTEIATENQLTLVMSIHNVELAREFFPRIIGLKNGHILFDSPEASTEQLEELYHLSESELVEP
ncbi:MAG: ATP-binding cassette domain-containing protein [Akkermansiaceae bacterium]|nr:ATP-binding cassette domain-containing protein [Akkermansiaceae bacterium]